VTKVVRQKVGCDLLAVRVLGENSLAFSDPELEGTVLEKIHAEREIAENILEKSDLNELEIELLKRGFVWYAVIPLIARDEKVGFILAASRDEEKSIEFLRNIAGQLAIAIHEAILLEMKKKACEQIEKNIEQFAILVDRIRNPLAAAQGFVEIFVENEGAKKKIKEQLDRIVELVEELERGWVESEAIRDYLRREKEKGW